MLDLAVFIAMCADIKLSFFERDYSYLIGGAVYCAISLSFGTTRNYIYIFFVGSRYVC